MDVRADKLKKTFGCIFKSRSRLKPEAAVSDDDEAENDAASSEENYNSLDAEDKAPSPFVNRALPPLPANDEQPDYNEGEASDQEQPTSDEPADHDKNLDYAASIERVKDCGWYWGELGHTGLLHHVQLAAWSAVVVSLVSNACETRQSAANCVLSPCNCA